MMVVDQFFIVANPFLLRAANNDELRANQALLSNLFPNYDIKFDDASLKGIDLEQYKDRVTGEGPCAAWVRLLQKELKALSVESVIEAFEECQADFLIKSISRHPDDGGFDSESYEAAAQYEQAIQLLKAGDIKGALYIHADMSSDARERIWTAQSVQDGKGGVALAVFFERHKYPNRLGPYQFF